MGSIGDFFKISYLNIRKLLRNTVSWERPYWPCNVTVPECHKKRSGRARGTKKEQGMGGPAPFEAYYTAIDNRR